MQALITVAGVVGVIVAMYFVFRRTTSEVQEDPNMIDDINAEFERLRDEIKDLKEIIANHGKYNEN